MVAIADSKATFTPTELLSRRTPFGKIFSMGAGRYKALHGAVPIHAFDAEKKEWHEIDARFKATEGNRFVSKGSCLTTVCDSSRIELLDKKGNRIAWTIKEAKEVKPEIMEAKPEEDEEKDCALSVFRQAGRNAEGLLSWREIFPGVDMNCRTGFRFYDEFVFASPEAARDIVFCMETGDLTAKQEENGSIVLTDKEGETVFVIAPPFLYDAEQNEGKATVKIEKDGDGYQLTYSLDPAFTATAAYPVTLDPTVRTSTQDSGIADTFVQEGKTGDYSALERLYVTDSANYDMRYALLKVTSLPPLGSSHFITSGKLYMRPLLRPSGDTGIYCRNVFEDWSASTVTYADFPDYGEDRIQDYILIRNHGSYYFWKPFDITSIARQWYLGNNHGVALTPPHDTTYRVAIFHSTDAAANNRPYFEIEYASLAGLEDYITYDSVGAGRAGSGSVSLVNGNMIFLHGDTSMNGARMPVSVTHVYNSCDADANPFFCGYGWRTNFHQTLHKEYLDTTVYYVYTDGDGTEHWFKPTTSAATKYTDESGLSMELVPGSTSVTIRDKGDGVMTFPVISATPTAAAPVTDKVLISTIADALGNTITVSSTGMKITAITDGAGRITTFVYTNDLLAAIRTPWQGSNDCVRFAYADGCLTGVTYEDNRTSTYTYQTDTVTGHRLLKTATGPEGTKAAFTYANTNALDGLPHVVTETEVTGGTGDDLLTASHTQYSYDIRLCIVKDLLTGNSLRYHFNDNGNCISVDDGLGYAVYANYDRSGNNANAPINHPTTTSRIQRAVNNLLTDGLMLRGSSAWVKIGTGTIENSVASGHFGRGYKKLTVSNGNELASRQTVTLEPEKTYTLSAYVETEGPTCLLRVTAGALTWESAPVTHAVDGNSLTRMQVTFTVPAGVTSVSCDLVAIGTNSGNVTRWDCAQLEIGEAANHINLIENSDFHGLSGTSLPAPWAVESTSSSYIKAEARADCDEPMPDAVEGNAVRLRGRFDRNVRMYQTIRMTINPGDRLTIGGWCAAFAKPANRNEAVYTSLQIWESSDNFTDWSRWTHVGTLNFNSQEGEWQFACSEYASNHTTHWVRIAIHYNRQINHAYFSNLFLYKEQFGTNHVYDARGNRTRRTSTAGHAGNTTFDDFNNVLTSATTGRTVVTTNEWGTTEAEKRMHLLRRSVSPMGTVSTFQYDAFGNCTESRVQENSSTTAKFIRTEGAFTTAGTYVASQTDARGKTVTTVTDADRGTTTSVTDPTGQTVFYTYDTLRRPTETATRLNGQGVISQSAYDSTTGYLTSVTHNTDTTTANNVTYNFAYDTLGRQISVSVGSNVLSTTYYNALLRMVDHIVFGNGGAVQYLYDTFSRVIGIRYENETGDHFSYGYDAQGRSAYVIDHARGVTVYTDYDLAGRPCQKTHLTATGHAYTGTLTYNGYDLLHQFTEFVGAARTRYVTGFGYDIENRVTALTYGAGSTAYTYDQLGRITQRTVKPASTSISTSYTYVPGGHGDNSTTGLVQTIAQGGVTLTYAYDNRGNITSVSDGTKTTSYGYDAIGQLIRVNDQTDTTAGSTGTTWVFAYDLGGNIQSKTSYPYIRPEDPVSGTGTTIAYTYGNPAWRDQLTAFDGVTIEYDDIGNPTDDGTWEYTWQHGRQLQKMQKTEGGVTTTVQFEYNEDGLRTKKTVTTGNNSVVTEYVLHGKNVVHMTCGTDVLHFYYDAQGKPAIVIFNGTAYGYLYNLQGDVIALVDGTGAKVVEYTYDAWGKPTGKTGSLAGTLGTVQPFRYRGYVFDEETGEYYCRSRQYSPLQGRFVNADSLFERNMFSYCGNSPCSSIDPDGFSSEWKFALVYPLVALDIGQYIEGKRSKNITTTAVRFAVSLGLSNPKEMRAEGTQVNAVRHVLWTGIIKSKYGEEIARKAVESHEDEYDLNLYKRWIRNVSPQKLSHIPFGDRGFADSMCDMLNNDIALGMHVKGKDANEICRDVLDIYHSSGLWVLKRSEMGFYHIEREILNDAAYSTALERLDEMDAYGFVN